VVGAVSGPDRYTFTARLRPRACECGHLDTDHVPDHEGERFENCDLCECGWFSLKRTQINNSNTRNET
jgi:hypothetical protein